MTEFLDFNFSTADEIGKTLAQRLKALRVQKEIAQADMAERMGVSRCSNR
jgi:DNA-binding XRE family transcriptional regulator